MTAQGEGGGTDLSGRLMLGEAGEEILPESPYRDVLCDGRWIGPHGIGRFASEVFRCLPGARILEGGKEFLLTPADPLWIARQIMRYRPRLYFTPGFNPPLKSPCPFIVTVHDLIHLKVPEESGVKKWAYYNALLKPALIRSCRSATNRVRCDIPFCRSSLPTGDDHEKPIPEVVLRSGSTGHNGLFRRSFRA